MIRAWVAIFYLPIVWGVVLGLIAGGLVVNALSSSKPANTPRLHFGSAVSDAAPVSSRLSAADGGSALLMNLPADPRVRPISRGTDIVATIEAAAREFNQSPAEMLAVAKCESSLRPDVYGDSGAALGLFQFWLRTWSANSTRLFGYDVGDLRADPVASSRVAAWMFSRGQSWQWTCRG